MREQRWCWVCELCGHRWLCEGIDAPDKCASSKCRKRHWHTRTAAPPVDTKLAPAYEPADVVKADIAALRAICAKPEAARAAVPDAIVVQEQCKHSEWVEEIGELVRCILPEHGPKTKHRRM